MAAVPPQLSTYFVFRLVFPKYICPGFYTLPGRDLWGCRRVLEACVRAEPSQPVHPKSWQTKTYASSVLMPFAQHQQHPFNSKSKHPYELYSSMVPGQFTEPALRFCFETSLREASSETSFWNKAHTDSGVISRRGSRSTPYDIARQFESVHIVSIASASAVCPAILLP